MLFKIQNNGEEMRGIFHKSYFFTSVTRNGENFLQIGQWKSCYLTRVNYTEANFHSSALNFEYNLLNRL